MRLAIQGKTPALSRRVVRETIRQYADLLGINPEKIYLRFTRALSRTNGAEMWPNKKSYTIRCSTRIGAYRTLQDLAHEMLHIEQYIKGNMTDKKTGTVWRKRLYTVDLDKQDEYYNAPWEIDANGRTYWLYKRCRKRLAKQGIKLRH